MAGRRFNEVTGKIGDTSSPEIPDPVPTKSDNLTSRRAFEASEMRKDTPWPGEQKNPTIMPDESNQPTTPKLDNAFATAGLIFSAGVALKDALLVKGKGININAASATTHAVGAFAVEKDGKITRSSLLNQATFIRDQVGAKDQVSTKVLEQVFSSVPKEGLTRNQLSVKLLELDEAMVKGDKNKNGYLSEREIHNSPKLRKVMAELQKDVKKIENAMHPAGHPIAPLKGHAPERTPEPPTPGK